MGRLFGTDGVRGVANSELTCTRAFDIGRAAAAVLTEGCRRRPVFVIGGDTRASTAMLSAASASGLCSVGADVIDIGVVPTPAVAFLIGKLKADAGIMITASHNPYEYNGIKIFGGDGRKLPDLLEDRIESIVLDGVTVPPTPDGNGVGRIVHDATAVKSYIDHVKGTVMYSLDGLSIAVDCSNGSASVTAEVLFTSLGANVHMIAAEPDGVNVNENCGSTHIENLANTVKNGNFDCGIAFDGDADRCLCVDENGELVDGDRIMAICALDLSERGRLNKNTVVGTVMSNLGFVRFCEDNGLRFIATKVGDRFVLEEMLLEDYSFGGEQSGHIIFKDFATTGDGQLTAVQLLSLMRRTGKRLSELASVMEVYPQTSKNVTVTPEGKLMFYTDRDIAAAMQEAKDELGQDGRIVVRPSGTEPLIRVMAEGMDMDKIKDIVSRVAGVIEERIGGN
ncbi:MAG: phosphoglucosamine mutase [Ruminococcaceae bacterium]|nr:phosphoglucosamine mutase [Oscillospiraceae bacterium]